mmetsp:Transcript_34371/g.69379  ORF Transcript_34371/g.69379 Transcript_34371/m.69379 type:complete len:82 (+) Transcript_34371:81-326(+)
MKRQAVRSPRQAVSTANDNVNDADDYLAKIERAVVLFGGALLHLIVGIKIMWGTITPFNTMPQSQLIARYMYTQSPSLARL